VSTAVFVQQAETDDATTNQESRFSKMKKNNNQPTATATTGGNGTGSL